MNKLAALSVLFAVSSGQILLDDFVVECAATCCTPCQDKKTRAELDACLTDIETTCQFSVIGQIDVAKDNNTCTDADSTVINVAVEEGLMLNFAGPAITLKTADTTLATAQVSAEGDCGTPVTGKVLTLVEGSADYKGEPAELAIPRLLITFYDGSSAAKRPADTAFPMKVGVSKMVAGTKAAGENISGKAGEEAASTDGEEGENTETNGELGENTETEPESGESTEPESGESTDGETGESTGGESGESTGGESGESTGGESGESTGGESGASTDGETGGEVTDGESSEEPGAGGDTTAAEPGDTTESTPGSSGVREAVGVVAGLVALVSVSL